MKTTNKQINYSEIAVYIIAAVAVIGIILFIGNVLLGHYHASGYLAS